MSQVIDLATRQNLTLTREIACSGEGRVWRTSRDGILAKIYHHPTSDKIRKLEVMIANPPEDKLAHLPHISYAWPLSLLLNQQGQKVGFLMPEIKAGRQLTEIYNPRLRKKNKLEVDWQFLHATAYNIALFMESIHKADYVIGDVKPENILVNPQALPSIIDTDSFQVRDRDGTVYRCPVGSEGFTPPELIGKNFAEIDQTEVHDRFRLGVIVFTLLFGYEPFKGVWQGGGEAPEPSDWVKYGYWTYGTNGKVGLADYMIPLDVVHPDLKELFLRCFNDGLSVPTMRPTVTEWKQVLAIANRELYQCRVVGSHFYHREHKSCYWCERRAKGFPEIFDFQKSADPIAYFNHGKMKYERGDYQGAIDDFSQSIYMNPNYAESYNGRGLARFALGNKKEAIADYDTAIHLKPDYVEAYHNRANAKYSLGYLRGAIADLQQAAELLRQQGNRGEHQRLLNKIESYCQTIDTPEKLKWDRHIENWFTDQNYQRKVATDFAFRNQVIPGYENHSAVSPEPVTPGEPIYYDLRLALTISSKEKKVRLFKGGVLAGIGAVLIWFGGVNLIRWGGGLGVASGGFVVLNTLVSTVDDTEKARQEREKARQERARLAMYEHKKKEEEKEINRRIQKHSLEIDKEINRRLLSFSGIPVHILTDPNCVNSLSYADQICAKIVLKQIIQQQQTEANQAEEDDDSALGNLILFLIALGLIGIWK